MALEGLGDVASKVGDSLSKLTQETLGGLPRTSLVPTSIMEQNLLSPDSIAYNCFAKQKFSSKLQVFLIGYVNSVYSNYSVYK